MSEGGVYDGAAPGVTSASNSTTSNSSGISNPGGARAVAAAAAATDAAATAETSPFTAEMRDRQARGRDPYNDSSDGSIRGSDRVTDTTGVGGGSGYRGSSDSGSSKDETFAVLERRRVASQILDSPELLMMAAQRDDETIPATRLRYTRMLCGLEEPLASGSSLQQPQQQQSTTGSNRRKSLPQRNPSSGGATSGRKAR
ncbi:hypothetical protein F4810DRAFT_705958 [Camillea tinctor]|nr:hypothetical protein F4810DRAFT_705958 [Camillea tinctor]